MRIHVPPDTDLDHLFAEADLTVVDVGARERPRGDLRALARWAHMVAVEADAEEASHLESALAAGGWRAVTVIAAAAGAAREATLYRTQNPGFASLLPPNARVAGRYVAGPHFAVEGTEPLATTPLDELAVRHGIRKATIVKLDTQGTELDILQSAPRLLSRTAAVTIEAMFEPMYLGQPLFGDADADLRARGFRVADLELVRLRGKDYRPDVWSRRQAAWAHAHYIRDPTEIDSGLAADLLAAVLAFGFIDLAIEIVALHLPDVTGELEELAAKRTRSVTKQRPEAEVDRLLSSFERA